MSTASWSRRYPSAVLLVAQLAQILIEPFLSNSRVGQTVVGVLGTIVAGVALWAVRRTPVWSVVAFALGLPAVVFAFLQVYHPGTQWMVLVTALLYGPFYLFVSLGQLRYLFSDDRVSGDELYAIGAAFTVVAWGFAYLYVAVEVIWPGSFSGAGHGPHSWYEMLFLSFSNLTSCGLSDILPVLDHARSLVIVEQVAGVMYVGLVVARLVGLTVQRARR